MAEPEAVRRPLEDSATVVGVLLLIVSALAFTRGLQRLYEGAYKLPTLGMRNTTWDLVWLAGIVLHGSARPVIAGQFDRPLLQLVISPALATAAWTATPYLLLGRRLPYRALLAGALLAALGMAALAASSVIWLPRAIASSADQFGVMGVAFALLSWLVGASVVLVVAATGGAVTAEGLRDGWR